ncbi:MAG: solute carrier family 23 protein [Gammaproteobacteria bacterium]
MNDKRTGASGLVYAVDETPPPLMAALFGFQNVALVIGGIALTPLIALQAAGADPAGAEWVVFAALLVSGLTTMLQAAPVRGIGAGYILFMGTSGAFLAVSISAIAAGGLPLLATLVVASSLIQFLFARNLGLLRRVVNPTVGGTILTLIAVTIIPISFDLLDDVPTAFAGATHAPIWAAVFTLCIMLGLSVFGGRALRVWGPVIGLLSGSLLAWALGLVNLEPVRAAALIGLPGTGWPGFDLSFGTAFWILLPGFLIVTIVGAIETYGDGIAIQEVSHQTGRPVDFRVVQGAVNADGVGNLVSGLFGTLPNTTYSTSISVAELTGVAARRVGLYGGIMLALLAFSPKVSALLQAVPGPVSGVFIFFLTVLLFVHGIRLIASDGFALDNAIVFGVSFWAGTGFQGQQIFAGQLPETVAALLQNGMTSGGITALVLSFLVSLKRGRAVRTTVPSTPDALGDAMAFVTERGTRLGWRGDHLVRLQLALEEAFLFQCEAHADSAGYDTRIALRGDAERIELELTSARSGANLEALIQHLADSQMPTDLDIRLRILRGVSDRIEHQQYSNADYLAITLTAPTAAVR